MIDLNRSMLVLLATTKPKDLKFSQRNIGKFKTVIKIC